MMQFSQVYYYTLTGWTTVASPGLDPKVKSDYATVQATNAPKSVHYLDESGRPLRLSEWFSEGNHLYINRCQYGFVDQRGRPSMFAHSYVIPWSKELSADPADAIFIEESSFAANKDAVSLEKQPATQPLHGFAAAFAKTGAAWNQFAMLTLAVYAIMESREGKPLVILTDCKDDALKALVYCIYMAMPYAIRRKLSVADAYIQGAKAKNLIITAKPIPGMPYFDLSTGENNILTPEWAAKNKKNQFMRYFGNVSGRESAQQYFAALDGKLRAMGKPNGSSAKQLFLADTLLAMDEGKPLTGDDMSLLYAMITSGMPQMDYLDGYMAVLLDRQLDAETPISEEMHNQLYPYLLQTNHPQLIECRMRYRRMMMLKMSKEDAAKVLLSMKHHKDDSEIAGREFDDAQQFLLDMESGRDIFSLAVRMDYLTTEPKTYEGLKDTYSDCRTIGVCATEVIQFTKEQAFALYQRDLKAVGGLRAMQHFSAFVNTTLSEKHREPLMHQAKEAYWSSFDITAFRMENGEEYRIMKMPGNVGYEKMVMYAQVLQSVSRQMPKNPDDTARLYLALLTGDKYRYSAKEKAFLWESCRKCVRVETTEKLRGSACIRLAYHEQKETGRPLLQCLQELTVTSDMNAWVTILKEAPCFMTDGVYHEESVEKLIQSVQYETGNTNSNNLPPLAAAVLGAYQAIQAEKRQMEKDELRAQKEEMRRQNRSQRAQNGLNFGKFGFGKKDENGFEEPTDTYGEPTSVNQTAIWGREEQNPQPQTPQQPEISMQFGWANRGTTAASQAMTSGNQETDSGDDVIYSGRNLSEMRTPPPVQMQPETVTYQPPVQQEEEPQKKGKLSGLLGRFKK